MSRLARKKRPFLVSALVAVAFVLAPADTRAQGAPDFQHKWAGTVFDAFSLDGDEV